MVGEVSSSSDEDFSVGSDRLIKMEKLQVIQNDEDDHLYLEFVGEEEVTRSVLCWKFTGDINRLFSLNDARNNHSTISRPEKAILPRVCCCCCWRRRALFCRKNCKTLTNGLFSGGHAPPPPRNPNEICQEISSKIIFLSTGKEELRQQKLLLLLLLCGEIRKWCTRNWKGKTMVGKLIVVSQRRNYLLEWEIFRTTSSEVSLISCCFFVLLKNTRW